ncbi:MAG TPA: VCBS repeat-containing protein, partial [Planctomycetota bacterium]|nr:VCBS repeat-containing protein [Planctomycetota bacterium]
MRRRGAALLATALVAACDRGDPAPGAAPTTDAPSSEASSAAPFSRRFVDVASERGLAFRHETGGAGEKLLPETLGAAAVVFDLDGDGALDVFFADGRPVRGGPGAGRSRLFRNRGDGTFEDASARLGRA